MPAANRTGGLCLTFERHPRLQEHPKPPSVLPEGAFSFSRLGLFMCEHDRINPMKIMEMLVNHIAGIAQFGAVARRAGGAVRAGIGLALREARQR